MSASLDPFEECPPEIWSDILDIACLDDGTTARSLSLVSRRAQQLSHAHLYRSIKIDNVRQLLKLEETISKSIPADFPKNGGRFLGTRVLSVTMPAPFHDEVYPEDSLEPETTESEDGNYQPSESTNDGSTDSELSDQDVDATEESETGSDVDEEAEVLIDVAEIGQNDPLARDLGHVAISTFSDMADSLLSLDRFDYRVQRALRNLLELCAETLEVFSWYFYPWNLAPVEFLFPRLPRLRYLSIYGRNSRLKRDGYALRRERQLKEFPLLFPSLEVFRMVGKYWNSALWWADILRSCPQSKGFQIVTIPRHDPLFRSRIDNACLSIKRSAVGSTSRRTTNSTLNFWRTRWNGGYRILVMWGRIDRTLSRPKSSQLTW